MKVGDDNRKWLYETMVGDDLRRWKVGVDYMNDGVRWRHEMIARVDHKNWLQDFTTLICYLLLIPKFKYEMQTIS
jgi:hypothetical protein